MMLPLVACALILPLLTVSADNDTSLVKITKVSGGNIGVLDSFEFNCSVVKNISDFSLSLVIDGDMSGNNKSHRVSNVSTHWDYSFSFGPILLSDNGTTFMCTIEIDGGSSDTLPLNFENPTATISVQSKTSVLGLKDNFLFSCSVDDPHLELTLFVDNRSDSEMMKRINKTSAASGNRNAYNYTLMETLPTDNGTTFHCLASNKTFLKETYRTDTVLLQIKYAPLFAVANNETFNHFIKTGNNSLLNCSVSMSNPPLQSIKLSNNSENTKNVKMNSTTGIVSFTKSQVNNRGMYTCTASNSIGSTTLSYQTFIGGAPDKIQVSVKSTIFNDSIVIALGVNDLSDAPAQNLSAKLNWISDTETINFTNIPVKNKDFSEAINEKLSDVFPGNYSLTVTANNVLGTYKVLEQTLFVPGSKSLEVDLVPDSDDVVEGDDYSFTCEANAENIHTDVSFEVLINATHKGKDCDRLIKGGATPYSQNFTFVNTSYTDDKTIFTCVGNTLDESEDTEMGVLYGPTLVKAQTFIEKASKSNFNLTCTVARANPPVNGLTIEPHKGPNWVLKKNGANSVYLEFTKADAKKSSGQFVCHAPNEISTANMTFNLYVGGPPDNLTVRFNVKKDSKFVNITLNVTDSSSVPATGVLYYLQGVENKNSTCNLTAPMKGGFHVCDKQVRQSLSALRVGKGYTLRVYGVNHVGTALLKDSYTIKIPDKQKTKDIDIGIGVGVPVAVIILLIIVGVAVFCIIKRRRARRGFTLLSATDDEPNINGPSGVTNRIIT